ncbi:helix-turn-helix transcriptional regulator [Rhizobium sp. CG4]|uniref:AraC family transcriptional regulator n=1 Tax=unclassified Rhizobium TaxID=2613769 RepID=UPI00332A0324|nr:helix-turn-helix transcriptional regulator [Rhizobium sp. CG4]MCS4243112.1 AraC-like DNA-binding protein [Rhizobium sp. BIGb0125]
MSLEYLAVNVREGNLSSRKRSQVDRFSHVRSGLTEWQCRRVRSYITENVGKHLKVSELASQTRLSVGHFARAFIITFGVSPYRFVIAERIAKAKRLMTNTSYPLSEIALQCGLCDHAHFCRLFRSFEGLPPSEWRRLEMNIQAPPVP